jgi:ABC-type lipoprotein export system ATPase subunit
MSQVTKTYGSGEAAVHALDHVDFEVQAEEVVVVMGPSGAGKTTFLTIAGALLTPTSGTVEISGIDITALGEKDLPDIRRERIGFVFQSFNLLESLTAIENVKLVMMDGTATSRGAANRARELMTMLGLGHRLKSLPKNLSGGEKQRVAIARAVVARPELLLADEPTGNVDPSLATRLLHLFQELNRFGTTVLIATHDPNIITGSKLPVLRLEKGHLN